MKDKQLGHRVTAETSALIESLSRAFSTSQAEVIEAAVQTLHDLSSSCLRGAMNESEQLSALAALERFQDEPSEGRARDFMRRFAFRILDTMWLATRALDDNGIPQPVRGATGPTVADPHRAFELRVFEGRDAAGKWHRGPILVSEAAMRAFRASFRKGAQVYVDTALLDPAG